MADARIATPNLPLSVARCSGVCTNASFVSGDFDPTVTKPITDANKAVVFDLTSSAQVSMLPDTSLLTLIPFTSNTGQTSTGIRVVGWRYLLGGTAGTLWVPVILYDATLSFPTTANTAPVFPANTVTATDPQYGFSAFTTGSFGPAPSTYSPATPAAANDAVASVIVDAAGCPLVTVHFKCANTNAGTNGVLWNTI